MDRQKGKPNRISDSGPRMSANARRHESPREYQRATVGIGNNRSVWLIENAEESGHPFVDSDKSLVAA